MRDAWRLAFGTLTAVRVTAPRHVDRALLGRAMLVAPVTTAPLVLGWAVLGTASTRGWAPAGVVAALALIGAALLSRGLHLDGLADLADGLTCGHDPARSLEVMRRGDTGPAGVAALVLALLLDEACLTVLFGSWPGTVLAVVALVGSRLACAVCARAGIPPARGEGLGHGVAGTVGRRRLVALVAVVSVVSGLAAFVVAGGSWTAAAGGVAVVLVAGAAAVVTRHHAVRRLGGLTGDVIGAAVEVALAAALVAAAVLTP